MSGICLEMKETYKMKEITKYWKKPTTPGQTNVELIKLEVIFRGQQSF